jgi:integrase
MTKNGSARQVPLSPGAVEVLTALKALNKPTVLAMNVQQLDAIWRKGRDKAGIADLHFHDSRATAVTRLARKLDILDLARMIGHRDVRSLMAYYRSTAEDIAKKLG